MDRQEGEPARRAGSPLVAAPPLRGLARHRLPAPRRLALAALPLAFLGYLFLYPLATILWVSLAPQGRLDPAPFLQVAARESLRGVLWFTLWQAAVSTVLTVLLALPAAWVFARFDFPGKRLLRAALTIPFTLPTVVVASAFLALLGPAGPLGIDLRRSVWAILIAHVFYNYAVVVRTVGGLWAHLDPRLEEAARMLGAGRWRVFREVTLPLLRPALAAASSIVFLFTFTSFGTVLILGGLRYATLEVEIWRQTTSFLNLALAGALAVVQLVVVGAILWAYARYQERVAVEQPLRPVRETARGPQTWRERAWVAGILGFTGVFLGTPLGLLVERSLRTAGGHGFDHYRALGEVGRTALFVSPVEALANSLAFAFAATVLALVVGLLAAFVVAPGRDLLARGFDVLLMLPLGTSAVTIGLGFLVALDRPFDLRTSPLLVPLAHALVAVPFVVRTAVPVLRSVRERLREAATVLGAPPSRVWREVDLPLVSRTALVGAGFAFAISLGEFGATALIARPETTTMPVAIFRLLSQPGRVTFGQAMALATILMLVTALAIAIIERFRLGEAGEF